MAWTAGSQNPIEANPQGDNLVDLHPFIQGEVLPNAMIRDIMVANPHASKKDSILDAIDNRFIPMPDSLYADILQGQAMADAMDSLQDVLLGHSVDYEVSFNSLMNFYLHDTLSSFVNDRVNELLYLDFRLPSKYSLALRFLDQGNIAGGDLIISEIPSFYNLTFLQSQEYEQYQRYFNC
jgi:hypothetical protein